MNLSALPDLRAVNDPAGAAVTDDHTDLDNTQFLDAVRRAAALLQRQRWYVSVMSWRSCCPTPPPSWCPSSRRGASAR